MREIILVRHGEPDLEIPQKISANEIPIFLQKYNSASLKQNSTPSNKLLFLSQNAAVVCSDLVRSIQSAQKCSVSPYMVDTLFRESIPPYFQNDFFRFTPKQWLVFSRLLWLIGFSNNGESLIGAIKRAKKAANILIELSKSERVVLFGHGLFNILIAKELRRRGFSGKKVPAKKHWDYGIYIKLKDRI